MPQQAWSDKRERQYEHIEKSERDRGRSEKRAKEIAARTVNKERARSGEAGRRTKEQLYDEAKRMNIEGRSKMSKEQLQRAVDRRK
jgi:plasmid stabilization system protein ParE